MTRKHYKMIAQAIKDQRDVAKNFLPACEVNGALMMLDSLAVQLCRDFMTDNPRFDQTAFLTACEKGE